MVKIINIAYKKNRWSIGLSIGHQYRRRMAESVSGLKYLVAIVLEAETKHITTGRNCSRLRKLKTIWTDKDLALETEIRTMRSRGHDSHMLVCL